MSLFRRAARRGKQEVELFFGELKEGALLDRCRTDTHKIVLTLMDGQPVGVRLEPLGTYRMLPTRRDPAQAQPPRSGEMIELLHYSADTGVAETVRVFEERDL